MNSALREAEFGNPERARAQTASAWALSPTRDVQILAALAFARNGDSARAQQLAEDLAKRFPLNTVINGYWLPTINASIEINRGGYYSLRSSIKKTILLALQLSSPYGK